jgi:hypothetical protein
MGPLGRGLLLSFSVIVTLAASSPGASAKVAASKEPRPLGAERRRFSTTCTSATYRPLMVGCLSIVSAWRTKGAEWTVISIASVPHFAGLMESLVGLMGLPLFLLSIEYVDLFTLPENSAYCSAVVTMTDCQSHRQPCCPNGGRMPAIVLTWPCAFRRMVTLLGLAVEFCFFDFCGPLSHGTGRFPAAVLDRVDTIRSENSLSITIISL